MRSTALPFVLACLVAAPAAADVTVTATTSGKAPMVGDLSGTQTTRIKGNRMRMDMTQGDKETALILDFDGQRMIALDSKKREATITPQAKLQEVLGKTSTGEIKASVTPTAETKTIAGISCKVHNVSVEVPFSMGGPEMQMALVMAGPACLSKDAPGYADYRGSTRPSPRRAGSSAIRAARRAPARRWPRAWRTSRRRWPRPASPSTRTCTPS